jgi:hypothetical protein
MLPITEFGFHLWLLAQTSSSLIFPSYLITGLGNCKADHCFFLSLQSFKALLGQYFKIGYDHLLPDSFNHLHICATI